MKPIIVVLIIMIISSFQIGCTKKQTSDTTKNNSSIQTEPSKNTKDTSTYENESSSGTINGTNTTQNIKLIKKPNKTKYLLSNGIEIQREDKSIATIKGNVNLSIPKVFGLKDKALEDKLNKSIEKDIELETKNYAAKKSEEPMNLYPVIELNANNLLSISLRDLYSPPMYGFLYRLTDGKRLYLNDIFTSGTDYVPLLNEKIVESILMKEGEEENNLSRPFSTIRQDQNFVITEAELYIVFHEGEQGFLRRDSVSIPLSTIDDYVDVLDRYSGTERKTHEITDLIIRKNNIFITNKSDILKKANGNVWAYYPQISGLRAAAFEELVNNNIKNGTSEIANNKYLDGLVKVKDQISDYTALIRMQVCFNYYGVLCIRRDVSSFDDSKDLQQFNIVYSYDLIKKKAIDPKSMIRSYIEKNKELKDTFTKLIIENLKYKYSKEISGYEDNINSSLDYSLIMDKGEMYFSKYSYEDEMRIVIDFHGNTFKGIENTMESEVLFKDIIKEAPEDFFGW